jgi:hypothetical protein
MKTYFARKSSGVLLAGVVLIVFASVVTGQNMFRKVNDFDGDGKADFAVTRNENGLKYWWILQTTDGLRVQQWGLTGDLSAAGDYDGDGKTDLAAWRQTTNGNYTTFYILESQTNTVSYKSFINIPVSSMMHQDYNGDGKIDAGVQTGEPGLFLTVRYSGLDSGFSVALSQSFFAIRTGDMDGDGRADLVQHSFNDRNDIIIRDSSTNASRTLQFGLSNDRFQMADFDGDGRGDLTVWRSSDGTWWWLRSSDNVVNAAAWGQNGDAPVAADYDGDGKTDLAIYRRGAQSFYWIYGSQAGVSAVPWGTTTDSAVQY